MKIINALCLVPTPTMPVLWINRKSGSNFLVRGERDSLTDLSEKIMSEISNILNTNELDDDLRDLCGAQMCIEEDDDFIPNRNAYGEISYVTPTDAYKMTLWNIFPEDHFRHEDSTFKLPQGFIIRNRDEPYDFTHSIPSQIELDQELTNYHKMMHYMQFPENTDEALDPMNCQLHLQKMTGCISWRMDEDGNYPEGAPPCCCRFGIAEAIAGVNGC
jgi:hypothetical protein